MGHLNWGHHRRLPIRTARKIKVDRAFVVNDCGQIINPMGYATGL